MRIVRYLLVCRDEEQVHLLLAHPPPESHGGGRPGVRRRRSLVDSRIIMSESVRLRVKPFAAGLFAGPTFCARLVP